MIDEVEIKNKMNKVVENLENRFSTIRAGRANPNILHSVMVIIMEYQHQYKV